MAIINYLNLTYSTPTCTLTPSTLDPLALSKSTEIAEVINSGIQPLQNFTTMKDMSAMSGGKMDGKAYGKAAIIKGLAMIEGIIKSLYDGVSSSKARYCAGPSCSSLTVGDVCIVPQLYNAARFGVDVQSNYPYLWNVGEFLKGLEPVRDAAPEKQGDAQVPAAPAKPEGGGPEAKKTKK